jgi:hypothetical protein
MVYTAKYVRVSGLRELLIYKTTKLHVSGDTKEIFVEFFDNMIKEAVKQLIDKIPRKSKGDEKGELKRITIFREDIESSFYKLQPIKQSTLIRSATIRKELLHDGDTRLRVSRDDIPYFNAYIEKRVKEAMNQLIDRLPISNKTHEIKRVTFQVEDFR